tara:strand:+ start:958 stop:1893 length:936 start_codon:yes stop_codon:yes gene_type:complete
MAQKSPINLPSSNTVDKCEALCDLLFYYKNSSANLTNLTGQEMILTYDSGSHIRFNEEIYELDKISFSNPALHKIENSNYDLEINLHHRSTTNSRDILIIGVLCEQNDTPTKSSIALDVLNKMPKKSSTNSKYNTPSTWSAYDFIPDGESNKSFYYYKGSLIRTPYTPGIKWIVFDNPINCSKTFIDSLRSAITTNSIPVQNRKSTTLVSYNKNNANRNNKNLGSGLKCYTDKELRNAHKCMFDNAMSGKDQNRITLIAVIAIVSLIIIFLIGLLMKGDGSTFSAFYNRLRDKFRGSSGAPRLHLAIPRRG